HLSLAVPVGRVDHAHADVAPEESPGTPQPVGDDRDLLPRRGVLASEAHVQPAEVDVEVGHEGVVELEIEDRPARRRVDELDAHLSWERHRQVAGWTSTFGNGGGG